MSITITTGKNTLITQAAHLLKAGELVCYPTETVYALAADATSDAAISRIYAAKGRNIHTPLAVMTATLARAKQLAVFDMRAELLASRFLPGPLTLVLPAKADNGLSPLLNRDCATLAIRIPDHPVALALLREASRPIAATSTNISGQPSAVRVEDIPANLRAALALIIDDGMSPLQKGSTIVDLTHETPALLREGTIAYADIMAVLDGATCQNGC